MVRVVRPGGKVVVGDFTEKGFDMVSAVHRGEGRVHRRSDITVDAAAAILAAAGCHVREEKRSRFKIVTWLERT
jgi:hypothetical protein